MPETTNPQINRLTLYLYLLLAMTALTTALLWGAATRLDQAYLYGFILLLPLGVGILITYNKINTWKALLDLRERWGKADDRERDWDHISALFEYTGAPEASSFAVDEETWEDLNLDQVYASIDRTLTNPGENVLYRVLRTPRLEEEELLRRADTIKMFQENPSLREKVQLALQQMKRQDASEVVHLLWGELPEGKPYTALYNLLALAALVSLISPFFLGFSSVFLIATLFGVNSLVHYRENKSYSFRIPAITELKALLNTSSLLSKVSENSGLETYHERLTNALSHTRQIRKSTRFLLNKVTTSELDAFYDYVKIFFLLEVRSFYATIKEIKKQADHLRNIYLVLGELDAWQSAASYRQNLTYYIEPVFNAGEVKYRAKDIYHPLLDEPVSNAIDMQGHGILITGSNMSGKSTFLRTIGVNAVLAQTIFTCPASYYQGNFFQIVTSITKSDDLSEGKSFYYLEAERLLKLIRTADSSTPSLCIIDEVLSGTNYRERIAASQAILDYLSRQNSLVIAATHDLDLADRLADTYRCYHFTDRVTEEGLDFDYKLKKGISQTRNAIKLLEYLKYPHEIVAKASDEVIGTGQR